MTSEDDSSTLPRRQLGRFLRETREGQGLSIDQAARLAELSKSGLHRIETAQVAKVKIREIRAVCQTYGVPEDETERVLKLAEQAQVKSWHTAFNGLYSDSTFNMYIGLEAAARQLIAYHEIVPGLLQTADYARALISSFYRDSDPEDLDRRVELRLKRQAVITRRSDPVNLELLLHESALHRVVGSPRIMAAQLRHLAEISKLPNISLRIHPFASGCTQGLLHGPFVILDFGTDARGRQVEPPLVYFEGAGKPDLYQENADDVRRYHDIASVIRRTALDETQTRDLLRRAARSYTA
ncbi:helix-turn-helix domain-containing protein [Nocardia sp. NBC_00565]|uniref:helix-turn-helix domain-containing protein n=1 Tax=Nocardia sp. NBC_00565 TaxID=2975993 RepID=UPI002E80983D|nr:helix-turn-helix transcriptional regulator [Nocardia sp. NBC_00565]WUC04123.1 helix-turn-helix domain-containing protein [Nocardia sp. NBC_00565]